MGPGAEAEVVAARPVAEVVAGPGPRLRPVGELVAHQAGGGEQLGGELVAVGLVVVVGGGPLPPVDPRLERRPLLDLEGVGGDMIDPGRQDALQARPPVGEALARRPEDQVGVDVVEARRRGLPEGGERLLRRVRPAEPGEDVGGQGLDAEADPAEAGLAEPVEGFPGGRLGVGLDGDLGVRGDVEALPDCPQDPGQLRRRQLGGGPTAEEDCLHRRAVGGGPDLLQEGLDVGHLQVVHPGMGVEVAVGAVHEAERDVHVDAPGASLRRGGRQPRGAPQGAG